MAESSIMGLFQDPLLYQQAQDQAAFKRFAEMAQLDPLQQAQASLMYGGYQAGGALGRALGGEDPMLQQLSARNQLASQFDTSSAEGLINLSNALRQKGDLAGASQVAQAAMAAREKEATIQAKLAEKLTPQQKNAAAMADSQYQRGTSEWATAYNKNLSELANPEKVTKPPADFLSKAVELGFGEKARIGDYTPQQVAKINEAIFNEDIRKKAAGAQVTRIDLGSALEKVYLSKDREEAAKRWSEAGKAYEATVPLLNQLDQVEKAVPNAFTGAGAEGKLALSKALGSFGVNIGTKATDTEYVNAISSKVVQQIARVFPGSLAVKELDQLVKSKFNVAQEAPTILRLLGQIRDEMKAQAITYEQGSKLNDKDRTSFNSSLATGQNMQKINTYRDLENKYRQGTISDAERAQAKALKQELGL